MRIHLDPASRTAIYQQIVEQVRILVARGELADGDRLPSVRELALELRINPNTVAQAYRELEREGWVVSQQGRGVFVTHRRPQLADGERRRQLQGAIDDLLVIAWRLESDVAEVVEMLRQRASMPLQVSGGSEKGT